MGCDEEGPPGRISLRLIMSILKGRQSWLVLSILCLNLNLKPPAEWSSSDSQYRGVGLLLHIPPEGQSRLLEDPNRYCLSLKIICRYQTCRSSRYMFSLSPMSAIQIIRCLLNSLYVWCYLFWQSSSDLLKMFFPHLWNKEENFLNHCLAELLQI